MFFQVQFGRWAFDVVTFPGHFHRLVVVLIVRTKLHSFMFDVFVIEVIQEEGLSVHHTFQEQSQVSTSKRKNKNVRR